MPADAFLSTFIAGVAVTADPNPVQKDGGYVINCTVQGLLDGPYRVHVGPNANDTDLACYAGPGKSDEVDIINGIFTCVTPPMPVGGPYRFTFVHVLSGARTTSQPTLEVVPHHFRSRVISLRRILPPHWRLGFRTAQAEEYPQ